MSNGLTLAQKNALDFITSYIARYGYSPSFDEIKKALGLHSKSGVFRLVRALQERGRIRVLRNRARSITIGGTDYREELRRLSVSLLSYRLSEAEVLARRALSEMGEAAP